jgi:hypothetical protein
MMKKLLGKQFAFSIAESEFSVYPKHKCIRVRGIFLISEIDINFDCYSNLWCIMPQKTHYIARCMKTRKSPNVVSFEASCYDEDNPRNSDTRSAKIGTSDHLIQDGELIKQYWWYSSEYILMINGCSISRKYWVISEYVIIAQTNFFSSPQRKWSDSWNKERESSKARA